MGVLCPAPPRLFWRNRWSMCHDRGENG